MSSNDSKLHVFDDTNKVWRKALSTTTGVLKCDTSINTTGLATDTLQTAGNASLSSIDGKITACDTGSVVVTSSALPNLASTAANQATGNASLSSIDGKITACDTGSVTVASSALPTGGATAANQATANGHLSSLAGTVAGSELQVDIVSAPTLNVSDATAQSSLSNIDSKITACDTGSVTVTSSALPSGAATAALQTSGNASLSVLEGTAYADGDAIGVSSKGVLVMGKNGTNSAHPIHITNNGDVEVEIADFVKGQSTGALSFPVVIAVDQTDLNVKLNDVKNVGSYENLESNSTITAGSVGSGTVDVSDITVGNLFYNDTSTTSFDAVDIEVSVDSGSNWFKYITIYPASSGGSTRDVSETNMALHGITTIRIKNTSSTDTYNNVNVTVVGSP